MKKSVSLILSLIICLSLLSFTASAESPNIVDNADLLTSQQEYLLETTTDVIRDDYSFEVVVVTVNSTEGMSAQDYADDFYDYNGYGVDDENSGVLFLVDMGERNWFISTSGKGIELIADGELDYIEQEIIPYLSQGDYATCFSEFISTCDEILELDANGENFAQNYGYDTEQDYFYADEYYPYDDGYYDNGYSQPQSFNIFKNIIIALVIGFVIALIIVMSMKGKLKSVRAKSGAADYVVPGSMNLTQSDERFLYRHVTRTPRQQNNSNGRSGGSGGGVRVGSSGRSHGGRGGSF
ncbi:MAG: TPM domain-containing protein [Clostridia bacterium]|nr:TPM domain-containing protein [Clostridia bacterium]